MRQHFSQIVSRDFPDSRPTVELIFKQLSFIHKPLLFLALMLLPMVSWGANETINIGAQSSGAFTISGTTHNVAGYSGGTNTGNITKASDNYSAGSGSGLGSTSNIGSKLSSKKHIRFSVSAGETVRFYYYQTSGSNKATTFATSDYSQSSAYTHQPTEYKAASKNAMYFVDFTFSKAGTYAISVTAGQSIYAAGLKFTAGTGYKVTYSAGDGSGTVPTHADVAENDTFHIASAAGLTAPAGQEFKCWNDGTNDYNPGATYTMGKSNVTLTAQWTAKTDKYTVKYMDGTTHMGTETVEVGSHPTASEITTTKEFKTFNGWQRDGVDVNLDDINGTKDEQITLTAKYTANYATTLDFMAEANGSKTAIATFLASGNMTGTGITSNSAYEYSSGKTGYRGFKLKDSGAEIRFLVKANSQVSIFFGSIGVAVDLTKGTEVTEIAKASGDNARTAYTPFAVTEDMVISLKTKGSSTVTLEKIQIDQLYTATFANGGHGTAPAAQSNVTSVTLSPMSESGWDFMGWKADQTVMDGETPIAAGETFAKTEKTVGLIANTTFTGQWAESVVKYMVTYYDGTEVMGTEEVRKDENPEGVDSVKAGYIFKGWYRDAELQNRIYLPSLIITKDTSLYAKYEKAYALSVDFASLAGGSTSVADVLAANYYTHVGTNTSWDNNTSSNNGAYQGLKMKAEGTTIDFDVPANKLVAFKAGVMVNSKSDMYKDGTKVAENMTGGSTGTGANFKMYYFYKADADAHYQFKTTSGDAQVIKAITITDPYKVTFTVPEGADAVDPMYFKAQAITLPSATKSGENFMGWYDAATGGKKIGSAGDSYSPTADVELFAHFEAVSSDNTIKSLKYKKTGDADYTAIAITDETQKTYNVTIPYKATVAEVVYEKNHEAATAGDVAINAGVATFKVTAQNGAEADYTVNFTNGPKDPLCIIKATHKGATTADVTGLIGGTVDKNTQDGGKLGSNGHYFGIKLAEGTFLAGDKLTIYASSTSTKVQIFSDKGTTMLNEGVFGEGGIYTFTLTAATEWIYLYRTSSSMNPTVGYMQVDRPMNPVLTKATLCDKVATISESAKTVTVEVPFSTDITAVTPAFEYVSNDNSKVTITPAGAQDFTAAKTYRFTDKDGDYTEYEVSITKAAASDDATLKSLSVTGYDLDPAFAAETLEYTIERAYKDRDAELPAISYEVNDATATAVKTTEGKVVTITVTAEDGTTQKAYTITFTNKAASTDATLKSLMYGDKAIKLVADQYTYNINLPYGTTDVPALTAVKNDELASDPVINNATAFVDFQATSTATVTAESGDEQVYTVNFTVAEFPSVAIFDGSTMTAMATSPDASGLSWAEVGTTMSQADKSATYQDVSYTKSLQLGNTSATKHFTITVPENKMAKIRLLIMTNSSGSTRSAWITTSADKGNKEDAIMSVSSSTYTDLGDGTTDWLADNATYYIHTDNTVNFFVISVELKPIAPKCEVPAISAQPQSNTQFGAGDMTAFVTASVTDGGTLSYQWYNASDDSEVSGATAATLTTTTEGSYYVIITNTLADHRDNFVKSETAQLGYRTLNDATLSALGYGETAITLVDAQYEYAVELAKGTTEVPALTATTSSSYATKVITNATAFVNYKATSTVVVTAEDGTTQLTYTVNFTVRHDLEQVSVSGNTTWNWANAASQSIKLTDLKNVEVLMANIEGVNNDANFNSQALVFYGENVKATDGGVNYASIGHIKFTTTVPGLVTVEFADNGNNNRRLMINDSVSESSASKTDYKTFSVLVNAGEVTLMGVKPDKTGTNQYVRIRKITFTQATRLDRSDLTAGKVTGVCLENNVTHFLGAKFYYISHKAQDESSIVLAEVDNLKAGYPYIMIAEGKDVYYMPGEESATTALNYNGLYGTFENKELGDGYCIFLNNKYYRTHDGNNNGCYAHRAYLKLSEVSTDPVTTAPGESAPQVSPRFFILGGEGRGMVTGFDTVGETDLGEPRKFIIHNQVVIIRNGQMFNAQGALLR